MKKVILVVASALVLFGCDPKKNHHSKPLIVCTTSMVADAVEQITDTTVNVVSLMGPGVDPHLYKASQGDLNWLYDADIVVYSGLHLEGKMGEVLEKLAHVKPVFAMGSAIDTSLLLNPSGYEAQWDPHIWFDLQLWEKAVEGLSNFLQKQFPGKANKIASATVVFSDSLLSTHEWAKNRVALIPEKQRVMVTAHDAFSYLGKAYGIEVIGLQGISTASEYGLRDVSNLVELITRRKIPAVFIESSIPRRSIEAVVDGCRRNGHTVRIGGTLYSDALGERKGPEGTLIGAFRHNIQVITDGLTTHEDGNRT